MPVPGIISNHSTNEVRAMTHHEQAFLKRIIQVNAELQTKNIHIYA